MATWTTIPDSSLEPGKPIRSIDALALRDNPVAIAEGSVGAPRVVNQWFPYDYETGGDGVIWNQAIDGSVASVTTPDFEVGFDYLLLAKDISDSTANASFILFEPYISPALSFQSFNWLTVGNTSDTDRAWGTAMMALPNFSDRVKSFELSSQTKTAALSLSTTPVNYSRIMATTNQSVLRARIRSSGGGTLNGGSILMLKRKTNYQEFV
jgi:hypothetical protein